MCYAIPGKIESIDGRFVMVAYFDQRRKAVNELTQAAVGDYVFVQGGYVVQKVPFDEAQEILSAWQDLFSSLGQIDDQQARLSLEDTVEDQVLRRILDKASKDETLERSEMSYLLSRGQEQDIKAICRTANFLRHKYHQNACCVHGIIEISNYCGKSCAYCGIGRLNRKIARYRMTQAEIVEAARVAVEEHGFKALVLQSGEDPVSSADELADIVRAVKERFPILVVVSFGEVGPEGLEKLFRAGARGLLMRFETSNPRLYGDLHPGQTLETRLAHIRKAYDLGYLIMTGALVGLPGATAEDVINDILLARELNAEMFTFGPFLPHPQTMIAKSPKPREADVLKTLALARFLAPHDSKIVVTTAYETLTPDARRNGLMSGANSLMINATPVRYRRLYSIYPNRAHESESLDSQVGEAVNLLKSLGRVPMDLGVS